MSEPIIPYGNRDEETETAVLLALCGQRGAGAKTIHRLWAALDRCGVPLATAAGGSAARVFRRRPELHPRNIALLAACDADAVREAARALSAMRGAGILPLSFRDMRYPAAFRIFLGEAAPPLVYMSGNPGLFSEPGGAVVGTRAPSRAGRMTARQCARLITGRGWALVSGGATGVDHAAHQEALRSGGRTLVMLPQGALTYPLPSAWRRALEQGRLAMLSEVFPDAAWQVYAAVSRNALISAQSRCVCVIEPRKKGGSVLTARHGMAQGKPVFVTPAHALPQELHALARPLEAFQEALASSEEWEKNMHAPEFPPRQDTLWEKPPGLDPE